MNSASAAVMASTFAAVEPQIEGIRRYDHRRALVQAGELPRGRRGDDDRRLHLLAVRPHPGFPQPGERDRSPLPRAHAIGTFSSAFVLPGVEAVGGNEATAAAHGVAERRPV